MTIKTCRSDEHQTTRPVSLDVNVRVGVAGGMEGVCVVLETGDWG